MSKHLAEVCLGWEDICKISAKCDIHPVPAHCWHHSEWILLVDDGMVDFIVICPKSWWVDTQKGHINHPATGVSMGIADCEKIKVERWLMDDPEQVIVKLVASKLLQ